MGSDRIGLRRLLISGPHTPRKKPWLSASEVETKGSGTSFLFTLLTILDSWLHFSLFFFFSSSFVTFTSLHLPLFGGVERLLVWCTLINYE